MSAAEDAPVSAAEAAALFADLADVPVLVLAVSGGPDSTALLWLAARWRKARRRGPKLVAVTIDHRLRPESGREARAVARLARSLGVAHRILGWTGPKPATGVQQAARQARYRLIAAAARKQGATAIVTAHTLDDQAETVLFRLARGSGIGGLAGMAPAAPVPGAPELALLRPLLGVAKSRLVATLGAAGIAHADDPSNRDPRFTRPRLRALMPALAREGLTASRLALLARRARRAEAALMSAADAAAAALSLQPSPAGGPVAIEAGGFFELPEEVALRVLARAIDRAGDEGPVELGKLEALGAALREARGSGRWRRTLAGALVTLGGGRLTVERAPRRRLRAPKRP